MSGPNELQFVPHIVRAFDLIMVALALVGPAYMVERFPRRLVCIPLGALIFWLTLLIAGHLLSSLDPLRDAAITDSIWLHSGWLAGLVYTGFLTVVRQWYVSRRRKNSVQPAARQRPPL